VTPSHQPPPTELTGVMLDIGGGYGALVVRAVADDEGRQIDVADHDGRRTHAVVHRYGDVAGPYKAVFPSLRQGSYVLLDVDGKRQSEFAVSDGKVSYVGL